ncbi:hypothetical protein C0033_03270 [Clostridium sp. chh4-2]|uniref:glucosyltransferase domain-containing protein n=1 Tax=Clostridium sp. chh4-2 TaxID=2067550 RepID=UPI000CCFBC94|nr:glucosyltransferase domain-containing protein [Clostridium sp. chh4-2]PNV63681.1 hypothetical protein C0033_03270 [Clostridium sp. chh4-2]
MQISKDNIRLNGKTVLFNLIFLISSLNFGALSFFSIRNYRGFFIFAIIMCVISIFFRFEFETIRKSISVYKVIATIFIVVLTADTCYGTLLISDKAQYLASSMSLSIRTVFLWPTIISGIISAYFIQYLVCIIFDHLGNELKRLQDRLSEYQHIKKAFWTLVGIYLISISAIIRADVEYIDDMRRKADGYPGWEGFSRYLANILSKVINTNAYLADISPMTQIIAVFLLAVASLIVILTFTNNKKLSMWSVIAVLPLGISPFFLECLSYKFDAPFMALTILASVFPLLFLGTGTAFYVATVIVSVFITCTTYQAALGIFPVSIILLTFIKWLHKDEKDYLRLAALSAFGYLLGLIIYKVLIMRSFTAYVSSEIYSIREMPVGILSNLCRYLTFIYHDFDKKWLALILVMAISFIVLSVVKSKRSKWVTAVVSMLAVVITMCLSFGLYIVFVLPLFQCRAMYGFGVWLAILAVICTDYQKDCYRPVQVSRASCLALSWCFFVFSFVYGNALAEQQRYVDFRTEMVLSELNRLPEFNTDEVKNIQITGTVGASPIIQNMPQYNDGALKHLIQTTFAGDWEFNTFRFYNYYGLQKINVVTNLETKNLPVLSDSYYETIRGDNGNILVELKECYKLVH